MLRFLNKSVFFVRHGTIVSSLNLRSVLPYSRTLSSNTNKYNDSFTVSYLVESCGLSHDSASNISRYFNLRNRGNPDRVIAFFRDHDFSDTQIARTVRYQPHVLGLTPDRILLPKFQFFYSKGFSKQELAYVLSKRPELLVRSLSKCIVPVFDFYKSLFGSDEETLSAIKSSPCLLKGNCETWVVSRTNMLESYGIPRENIVWLIRWHSQSLTKDIGSLKNTLQKLREMGFDMKRKQFVIAFYVMRSMSNDSWDKKVNLYKKWGWSEETVTKVFLKHPTCMSTSEKKITAMMDYFVNKLGCKSLVLADCPVIINCSMDRRVIPRTKVIQVLRKKGLVSEDLHWSTPLVYSEKKFVLRFIDRYAEKAPELMKLYKKRLASSTPELDL